MLYTDPFQQLPVRANDLQIGHELVTMCETITNRRKSIALQSSR